MLKSRNTDLNIGSKVSLNDGLLTYIILASSMFFLIVIISLSLINALEIYNKKIEFYELALENLHFYLIVFGIILMVISILFSNLNKLLKLLPGNEKRFTVFKRSIIASFITTIIVGVLSYAAFGTISNLYYFFELNTTDIISMILISTFCWIVFFIVMQSLIEIPKTKKYILLSILITFGLSFLITTSLYNVIESMLWSGEYNGAYIGIFIWTFPFIFCSLTIGIIGLYGVKNSVLRILESGKPHFKRTTEVFLISSLPIIFLPMLAVYIHRHYVFYSYIVFVAWLTFIAVVTIVLLWTHNFIRRKREEGRLSKKAVGSTSFRSELIKDRTGITSFITFLIIVSVVTSLIYYGSGPFYEVDINRKYSTQAEYEILKKCEGLNYGSYWNKSLFYDRPNDPDYIPGYSEKVLINFINTTSLNFYSDKFEYLEENNMQREALFHYYAKVYSLGDYEVLYNNSDWLYRLRIFSNDRILFFEHLERCYLYTEDLRYPVNNTDINHDFAPGTFSYTFNKTYLVYMEIGCWEYYVESHEGYSVYFYQIVIMDEEFDVKLIIVKKPYQEIH
jgi:hypothetical protein